ncbi:MAG: S9 family peptidase [Candidatus Riflebacteria bacterium]|nr:S9 family peptidase [Candidatus Riflebacteria bacterium]
MNRIKLIMVWCFAIVVTAVMAQSNPESSTYQKPPEKVLKVMHAPLTPNVIVSPTHDYMILAAPVMYPPVSVLAEPMLRIAGVRINTRNHGLHNAPYWSSYDIIKVADGSSLHLALPADAKLSPPQWTADGKRFAFTLIGTDSIELWIGEPGKDKPKKIEGVRINPILEYEFQWMPDQKTLLVKAIPDGQGPTPAEPTLPPGPNIQESKGGKGPSSTYEVQDVLKNPHDEDLFDYYATAQLLLINTETGKTSLLGKPAIYEGLSPAPDGKHILLEIIHRPYSYMTTYSRFPREVEIWNCDGKLVHKVASVPLADSVPIWGVRVGPREFFWQSTAETTLLWAEALDDGDWNTKVPFRDRIMMLKSPFDKAPEEIMKTERRFEGILFCDNSSLVLINEFDQIKHWRWTYLSDFNNLKASSKLIWDLSTDERYKHPGNPVFRKLPNGESVIQQDGNSIYLNGMGASKEGDRPFLDKFNLKTLASERLFRSENTAFERFVGLNDISNKQFITRKETPQDPPNFFVRTLKERIDSSAGEPVWKSELRKITDIQDPTPELRGITKKLVKYKRADGVDLSFTLYLPPGYKEGDRLPALLWAYPLDYTDSSTAGQVVGSTQKFTTIGHSQQLYFLLEGYAVIDNPLLPIVGDANKIYDKYMEQLVDGAKAAVDKAVEIGVVDRNRIGIAGHSHGALMTVNLLAHSDLFRAGVARSGSYNKSLVPFGFQNERRTLWEAPEVYSQVSPLFHATKIKSPLLLIHGELDANPGTVTLQSEKMYEAIRGNGGNVRLVLLPFESHGYSAMESNEHVLYEMLNWFDRYVKNAPPRDKGKK